METTRHFREEVLEWCTSNLKGRWTEIRPQGNNQHVFQIQDGKDAMLFKLTWCQDTVKPKFS